VLLYYITDRTRFPGPEPCRRELLLAKIAEAARAGVDYVQLREKDLPGRELESLACDAIRICRETRNQKRETKLLVNSRSDVALAAGADGVHLPSDDILASDARAIWSAAYSRNSKLGAICGYEAGRSEAGSPQPKSRAQQGIDEGSRNCIIAVSCHTAAEVRLAEANGADFAVFGPVFEKVGTSRSVGLDALGVVCRRFTAGGPQTEAVSLGHMPVLAIGGVTLKNARACLQTGAAGIAGIRLFQEDDMLETVKKLRQISLR